MSAADKIATARALIAGRRWREDESALRDTVAALADLADAQAQEIARQAQRVEQLEFALRRLSTDEAPDWVRSIAYSEIGDAP